MLFFTDKSITLYILYLIIIIIVVYKCIFILCQYNMAGWKWYVPYVPPVKQVEEHVAGDWVVEVQWKLFESDEWYKTFTESVANKLAKTLAFWANLWVKARKLKKWERVE